MRVGTLKQGQQYNTLFLSLFFFCFSQNFCQRATANIARRPARSVMKAAY